MADPPQDSGHTDGRVLQLSAVQDGRPARRAVHHGALYELHPVHAAADTRAARPLGHERSSATYAATVLGGFLESRKELENFLWVRRTRFG